MVSHFISSDDWFVSPSSRSGPWGAEAREVPRAGAGDRTLSRAGLCVQPSCEQVSSGAVVLNDHVRIAG